MYNSGLSEKGKVIQGQPPRDKRQLLLAVAMVILSTLWTQITMQRDAPFTRTAQCYFNRMVLEHDSEDIYEGKFLTYWRTQDYSKMSSLQAAYERLLSVVTSLPFDSLFQLRPPNSLSAVKSYAYYGTLIPSVLEVPLSSIHQLFSITVFSRVFYQGLNTHELSISLPIQYRREPRTLLIKLTAKYYSSLQAKMTVQVDIGADAEGNGEVGARVRPTLYNMGLAIPYIRWVLLALALPLFLLQLRDVSRGLNRTRVWGLGEIAMTLLLLTGLGTESNGFVCGVLWLKSTVYLSESGNKLMLGRLFLEVLPTYGRLLFNILLLMSAFVFCSMVLFTVTRKFETPELAYFQFIFNYFQYGIYENFMAIGSYGLGANLFYFFSLFLLISVSNNILQSILASQVLKQSYLKGLLQMLTSIDAPCPVCKAQPRMQAIVTEGNNELISQFLQRHSFIPKPLPELKIYSPKLSPFLPPMNFQKARFQIHESGVEIGGLDGYHRKMRAHMEQLITTFSNCYSPLRSSSLSTPSRTFLQKKLLRHLSLLQEIIIS